MANRTDDIARRLDRAAAHLQHGPAELLDLEPLASWRKAPGGLLGTIGAPRRGAGVNEREIAAPGPRIIRLTPYEQEILGAVDSLAVKVFEVSGRHLLAEVTFGGLHAFYVAGLDGATVQTPAGPVAIRVRP